MKALSQWSEARANNHRSGRKADQFDASQHDNAALHRAFFEGNNSNVEKNAPTWSRRVALTC
jgi:hypothetical protein